MLHPTDVSILRLILRSKDIGNGWRKVSPAVWPLVDLFRKKELIQAVEFESGGGRVRLTNAGVIVADAVL